MRWQLVMWPGRLYLKKQAIKPPACSEYWFNCLSFDSHMHHWLLWSIRIWQARFSINPMAWHFAQSKPKQTGMPEIVGLTLEWERVSKEISEEHLFFLSCRDVIRDYFIFHYGGRRHTAVSCFRSSSFLDCLGVLYSQQQPHVFFFFFFFLVRIIIPARPVASVVLVQWEPSVSACCSHSFRFAAFPLKHTHAGLPYQVQSWSSSTGEQNRLAFKSVFTFEAFWNPLQGR